MTNIEGLTRKLIGKRVVVPVSAKIVVDEGRFKAIFPDGKKKNAQTSEVVGADCTAIEFFDGVLGFVMGSKVLFGLAME